MDSLAAGDAEDLGRLGHAQVSAERGFPDGANRHEGHELRPEGLRIVYARALDKFLLDCAADPVTERLNELADEHAREQAPSHAAAAARS